MVEDLERVIVKPISFFHFLPRPSGLLNQPAEKIPGAGLVQKK
jgi:hypothetical protein